MSHTCSHCSLLHPRSQSPITPIIVIAIIAQCWSRRPLPGFCRHSADSARRQPTIVIVFFTTSTILYIFFDGLVFKNLTIEQFPESPQRLLAYLFSSNNLSFRLCVYVQYHCILRLCHFLDTSVLLCCFAYSKRLLQSTSRRVMIIA